MKKIFLLIGSFLPATLLQAQAVSDTVTIQSGYSHHTWYSLETGNSTTVSKSNWDIALATSAIGMGSSIRINAAIGTRLWVYPHGDTSAWSSIDTAGMGTWKPSLNSDTTWETGAFDAGINTDPFDLGWGVYNMMTHFVVGDSLFVIRLADNSYRKVWIQSLASGIYAFKSALLDGSGQTTHTINKADYNGKNFAYYSLRTATAFDYEPLNTDWDLLFTQYSTLLPGFGPYNVTGVLQNHGTEAVKAYPVDEPATYADFSAHVFSTQYNILGYDWKTYSGGTYVIEDSTVYFVKTNDGDIWKVIFTGFGGSANGNFYFTKEKISATGLAENARLSLLAVYPNPCTSGTLYVTADVEADSRIELFNSQGQRVYSSLIGQTGLSQVQVPVQHLEKGAYIVRISGSKSAAVSKIILH